MSSDQSAEARLREALSNIASWAEDAMTSTLVNDARVEAAFQQIKDQADAALAATPDKPSASDEEIARDRAERLRIWLKLPPGLGQGIYEAFAAAIQAARAAPSEDTKR